MRYYFHLADSDAVGFTTGVSKSASLPGTSTFGLSQEPCPYPIPPGPLPWGCRSYTNIVFAGTTPPKQLTPTRGTATSVPANQLQIAPPDVLFDGTNLQWRGLLTHFITPAFPVQTELPRRVWPMAFCFDHASGETDVSLELAIYVVDATGTVVASLYDRDDVLESANVLPYMSNRHILVPAQGATIPAGGRIVIEAWIRLELQPSPTDGFGNYIYGTQADPITFYLDGWDENIPPTGVGTPSQIGTLINHCASYIDIPVAEVDVFDAMRDAAVPTVVTETYETRILEARTAVEQRLSLRASPHVALSLGVGALDAASADSLDAALRRANPAGYRLPWWPDVQALAAPLPAGTAVVPINTVGIGFTVGGEVILYQAPGVWELGTIQSIDSAAQLTLVVGPVADWPAGTAILPIQRAALIADSDVDREASFATRAPLTFEVVELAG